MNVIIELGPADMDRLAGGDVVARAGIAVTPDGHPALSREPSPGRLAVSRSDLDLLRVGLPMRMRTNSGDQVTVIAQRGENALWAES